MRKILFVFFLVFSSSVFAQIGVSLYPINNTIGVKTSHLKPLSFELRMSFDVSHSTADVLYMFQPEANLIYRFRKEERVNFYSGISGGYGVNNANGNYSCASILIGVEAFPIVSFNNLTLTAEIDVGSKFFTGYQTFKLRGFIGVSYYFSKRNKNE